MVVFFSGACIIMMSGPKKEWVLCTVALLIGAVSIMLALDSVLDGMLGMHGRPAHRRRVHHARA